MEAPVLRRLILLASLLLPLSPALAQYARYDGFVQSNRGPLANQFIAVCTQPAVTTTQPCSPLAPIYGSSAGGALANPLQSDAYGNFHFYIANGTYTVQIYGPQVYTPYVLVDQTIGTNAPSNGIYVVSTLASAINAADQGCGSNACQIFINLPGSYCDATVLLSNLHTLTFGPGTYQANISAADSTIANVTWGIGGTGPQQTIVQSCPTSNLDVITDQNFASFTGGTSNFGVFRPVIKNLKIDGNSSVESSGYAIRLYGRGTIIDNVIFSNCTQDCIWGEYGGSLTVSSDATDIESQILNSKFYFGNGNFLTNKGMFREIHGLVGTGTTGWGIDTFTPMEVADGLNIYTGFPAAGGIKVETGGGIVKVSGEISGGKWGIYVGTSDAGPIHIDGALSAASSITGSAGLEVHSSNVTFNGNIFSSQNGIILANTSAFNHFTGTLSGNTVTGIGGTSGGFNIIDMSAIVPGGATDYSATFSATDQLYIPASGGTNHGTTQQFPIGTFVLGANQNAVVIPTGTLGSFAEVVCTTGAPSDGKCQFVETGSACTTTTTQYNTCNTTVTWPHAFADTNYYAVCEPQGIISGVGIWYGGTRTASTFPITTVNLVAGTATQFGAFDCVGIHY